MYKETVYIKNETEYDFYDGIENQKGLYEYDVFFTVLKNNKEIYKSTLSIKSIDDTNKVDDFIKSEIKILYRNIKLNQLNIST